MLRRLTGTSALLLVCTTTVLAGPLPEGFRLYRYMPSGMWMFINNIDNPERARVESLWAPVIADMADSGIDSALRALVVEGEEDPQLRLEAGKKWDRVMAAARSIPWSDMFRREVAFAERLTPPIPDVVILTRPTESSLESVKLGMRNLFEAVASLTDNLKLTETPINKVDVLTLSVTNGLFEIHFFVHGDVTGLVLGRSAVEQVTALLTGKPGASSMIDDPRFLAALKVLPEPRDAIMFFDFHSLAGQLREYPKLIHKSAESADVGMGSFQAVWLSGIDFFDCFDYSVTSESTRNMQTLATTRVALRDDALQKPLVRALTAGKPFDRVDQFVPKSASGFSLSSGVDFGVLYQAVRDFLTTQVPNSAEILRYWDELLGEHDLEPSRDLFSWLGPEHVVVSLPSKSPMQGEGVIFLRVKDPRLAAMKVNSGLNMILQHFAPGGMTIRDAVEVDAKGFRLIQHPGLMVFNLTSPCIGVYEDWLAVATSPQAVNACIATSKGAPGFTQSERFVAEGLLPSGPVVGCSFTDMREFGKEMGAVFFALGAGGGMALAQLPPEQARVPRAVLDILSRIAQAMTKIDFISSSASRTTFDGRQWTMEQVTTYRSPGQPAPTK